MLLRINKMKDEISSLERDIDILKKNAGKKTGAH